MRKSLLLVTVLTVSYLAGLAQYGPRPMGPGRAYRERTQQERLNFDPSLDISVGYGFPNLDKYLLDQFYGYYPGSSTYSGPVFATVDYRFNPHMSIGVMASYGKISRSYYSFDSNVKTFTGSLTNASFMINFVRYLPGSPKVTPYFRTAIGFNTGSSKYNDLNGQIYFPSDDGTTLAYQGALGVQLNVSKAAGFFVEAGYGKYIISGGLHFSFK